MTDYLTNLSSGDLILTALVMWVLGMVLFIPVAMMLDKLMQPKPRRMA